MYPAAPSMLTKLRRPLHGFTLVELLVVIAIIGILVAMLLPAVQAAREAARRIQCTNQFKQVGLALHNYHSTVQTFPTGQFLWLPYDGMNDTTCGFHDAGTTVGIYFGWATFILPYLEQQAKYDSADFGDWSAGDLITNYSVMGYLINTYICPSDPQGGEYIYNGVGPPPSGHNGSLNDDARCTNMAGVSDSDEWLCVGAWSKGFSISDGMLAEQGSCRIADVRDGTSNTLMVAEVTGGGSGSQRGHAWMYMDLTDTRDGINGPFTVPGDPSIAGSSFSYRDTGPSSFHPGGCHFLLVDGSVQFLSESIAQTPLTALTTRNGGEIVLGDSF